jgi:hypothetical protein
MSDEVNQIYGKIDALLGKRVGFAGAVARHREEYDFPLLTDVVDPAAVATEPIDLDLERAFSTPPREPESSVEADSPTTPATPAPWTEESLSRSSAATSPAAEFPETMAGATAEPGGVETADAHLETLLRRIVREELERLLGRG